MPTNINGKLYLEIMISNLCSRRIRIEALGVIDKRNVNEERKNKNGVICSKGMNGERERERGE